MHIPEQSRCNEQEERERGRKHSIRPVGWLRSRRRGWRRNWRRSFLMSVAGDRRDETVSAARDCLDKPRTARGIAQNVTQLIDRSVEAVVEIDEGVGGPNLGTKLIPGDNFGRALHQGSENLKRLLLQPEARTRFAQFARFQVELEDPEAQDRGKRRLWHQVPLPP